MYPNFYYIFKDWFGIELEFLKIINSFGFFVALSFLLAGYVMQRELKRKYNDGILGKGNTIKYVVGKAMSKSDYITSGITGFIFGFKLLPLLIDFSVAKNDPQSYLLSGQGSLLYGILLAAAFLGFNYWQDKKQRLDVPVEKTKHVDPSYYIGEMTLGAFIGGILGAKLFHILENLSEFNQDPMGSIMSFSGLTFYGGLIVGGITVLYIAKKRGIPFLHMLDVGGPAMMLSYGTGRIGCHVSGDGDWGIVNTAPKPNWMSFLPDWMWVYDYPHNVNSVGVPIPGCVGEQHCMHLDPGVFPTPFYETLMALTLFFILWKLRKKFKYGGILFGVYLIMNGIERFFIEKIRVNTIMDFLGMKVTQAEIISTGMAILGVILIIFALNKKLPVKKLDNSGTALE
ncbi:MAG: prolipoprotein diacylglyceryl transferase [Bacteroidia bacterium]